MYIRYFLMNMIIKSTRKIILLLLGNSSIIWCSILTTLIKLSCIHSHYENSAISCLSNTTFDQIDAQLRKKILKWPWKYCIPIISEAILHVFNLQENKKLENILVVNQIFSERLWPHCSVHFNLATLSIDYPPVKNEYTDVFNRLL